MIKLWKLLAPKFTKYFKNRKLQYTDNQIIFEFFDIEGNGFVVSKSWKGSSQVLQHLIARISNGTDEEIKLMSDAMLSKDFGPKLFWQRREL